MKLKATTLDIANGKAITIGIWSEKEKLNSVQVINYQMVH